jgi:hypothetical protein
MRNRSLVTIVLLSAVAGGPASAQQQDKSAGETSGAAVGGNVVPSTVIQKRFEGRSAFAESDASAIAAESSALAAGVPGVEGKRGAQSGAAAREHEPGRPAY